MSEIFGGSIKLDRQERAKRAVSVFRSMQPGLTGYARAMTGNQRLTVEITEQGGSTDGKKIYFKPPIALGDMTPHNRQLCDRRDRTTLHLLCPACRLREEVLIVIYHEIAHNSFETFAKPTAQAKKEALEHAIAEMGTKYAERARKEWDSLPDYKKDDYINLASLISPFLPTLVNAIEDARVDARMFEARKGTKVMFDALTRSIFAEGVEEADGTKTMWKDKPLNSQVIIGVFSVACGYNFAGWFDPEVEAALKDEKLSELCLRAERLDTARDSYNLSFKILARLRELGFCLNPNEPQDEEPNEEEQESNDDESPDNSEPSEADSDGNEPSEEDSSTDEEASSESGDDEAGESDSSDDSTSTESGSGDETSGHEGESGDEGDGDSEGASEGTDGSGDRAAGEGAGGGGSSFDESEAGDSSDGSMDDLTAGEEGVSDGQGEASDAVPSETEQEGLDDDSQGSSDGQDTGEGTESHDGQPGSGDELGKRGEDFSGTDDSASYDWESGESDFADGDDSETEAVDSGADDGDGGDSVDRPEYGTAEQAIKDLKVFTKHDIQGTPEVSPIAQQNKDEEKAVTQAIVQGQYFETSSTNVQGVREIKYGGPYPDDSRGAWEDPWSEVYAKQSGQICDMTIPEGILSPALLEMRAVFADNARADYEHHLRSGKINKRVLGKRAWSGDPRLFQKKRLPGKKSYAVLLGIDISASTTGKNLVLAKRAAMAQAQLLSRAGVDFAIYAHSANGDRGSWADGLWLDVYEIKSFNAPWGPLEQKALTDLGPDSENLDGHTVEYYRKIIERHTATDKIILYYSDGKMPAANHDEELEVLQREIAYCKKHSITLLGVGIRTDSPRRHGLDTVQVNEDSDLVKVVRHLKNALLHSR